MSGEKTGDGRQDPLARFAAASSAIRSGVLLDMAHHPAQTSGTDGVGLRVGLNIARAELIGVVGVLLRKGLITKAEIDHSIVAAVEAEQARYETYLSSALGKTVKLG